jgi:hypothetical protein
MEIGTMNWRRPGGSPGGLLADRGGAAGLEFALVSPLLAALLFGTLDAARVAARVAEAEALAGAVAAAAARLPVPAPAESLPPLPAIDPGRLAAVPPGVAVRAQFLYLCPGDSGFVPARAPRCRNGRRAAPYVEVAVEAPVTRLLPLPGDGRRDRVAARALRRAG